MNILVTGGAGFIGSNLALTLQNRFRDANISIVDDFFSGYFKNIIGFKGEVITGSIADSSFMEKLSRKKFDVIFHQAADAKTTDTDQNFVMTVNCEATKNLLNLALKNNASFVYASSAAVYGNEKPPMKVNGKLHPENIYGFSKYAVDMYVKRFMKEHPEFHVVGLRYFNVYGPHETYKGSMASMILKLTVQIMKGRIPRLFKWGEQKRDFVHVNDCVEANIRAFESGKSGIVNVGTGNARSFNEVVNIIQKALGTNLKVDYFDNPYTFYQNYTQADLTETKDVLGWYPGIQIEEGIPSYVDWIKKNVNLNEIDF